MRPARTQRATELREMDSPRGTLREAEPPQTTQSHGRISGRSGFGRLTRSITTRTAEPAEERWRIRALFTTQPQTLLTSTSTAGALAEREHPLPRARPSPAETEASFMTHTM